MCENNELRIYSEERRYKNPRAIEPKATADKGRNQREHNIYRCNR